MDDDRDLVVFFEVAGDALNRHMAENALGDPMVLAALDAHGFVGARVDGASPAGHAKYAQWVRGGEGAGIAIIDPQGRCWAARPGPQDPAELAAMLRNAAANREPIAALRARLAAAPEDPALQHALGVRLLELGCRVESEVLLRAADRGGVEDARHRLARLFALDGDCIEAREWLRDAVITPPALVTFGYVLFKEGRHGHAARVLGDVVDRGELPPAEDRRARLYLGKSVHMAGDDPTATRVLEQLIVDAPGTIYAAAAQHTLNHLNDPQPDHRH